MFGFDNIVVSNNPSMRLKTSLCVQQNLLAVIVFSGGAVLKIMILFVRSSREQVSAIAFTMILNHGVGSTQVTLKFKVVSNCVKQLHDHSV